MTNDQIEELARAIASAILRQDICNDVDELPPNSFKLPWIDQGETDFVMVVDEISPMIDRWIGEARGWQPIETAPKDGSSFLALCGGHVEKIAWFNGWDSGVVTSRAGPCWGIAYAEGYILDEGWDEGTGCYLTPIEPPTHWQPLPAPPEKAHD
jgi:hypothetical protein